MIIISVLEVDLKSVKKNYEFVKKHILNNQKICIVVKANAYGFGTREICKLFDKDADYFAVSCASEFFDARKFTSKPILILDPIMNYSQAKKLVEAGAELTISNFESFDVLRKVVIKIKQNIRVHIAINTGMNRFGFKTKNEVENILSEIQKTQNISICGVFSHYFEANNKKCAILQYNQFLKFKQFIESKIDKNLTFHIASSDGIFYQNGFDMVRVGMAIYTDKIYPTITLKSKIIDIQYLERGEFAGYSRVFKAEKNTKVAIVGIGYGDGIFRRMAGKGYALINGKFAKIIAVCMDSIIVDISNLSAKINDDVVLIGKSGENQIFICDMANWCDTIDYEIIVGLSRRVKRKYIR